MTPVRSLGKEGSPADGHSAPRGFRQSARHGSLGDWFWVQVDGGWKKYRRMNGIGIILAWT
jgi:hypothetical protein